ncbi:thioredoxin reductase [Bacteroidia bacterium]|nr:thioredoxin reductase [Bacteroidia bacterium]GHT79775.1 thioredoxin reductase [Bacteroidia bacterium]
MEQIKCLIVGSGPAGYTAAIYAARANLKPVVYQGLTPFGQLTMTTEIENFPSYPQGITGMQLMENMQQQAQRFKVDIRNGAVVKTDLTKRPFIITLDDGKTISAETLIIATGATAKYLGLPSETKYVGQGVSACATCDGFFYRKQDVAVVGGGDTACEEALYLAGICNKVYLIVRRNVLRASQIMQQRVLQHPKIEILFEHQTKEIVGDNAGVSGAVLQKNNGAEVRIAITGFFLAIGHHPNADVFKPYIETDEQGYIKTLAGSQKTNVDGVFACGDVQDPDYQQAITAAASGCRAALDAERFLTML